MAKAYCSECRRTFSSGRALKSHRRAKHPGAYRRQQATMYIGGIAAVVVLVAGGRWLLGQETVLPPTSIEGHVETWPEERISTTSPIPMSQQKHILEHDESERPGILLQYNCGDYDCPDELEDSLKEIAEGYSYVFMAPFPGMDAMISVAAYGDLVTLEEYNEDTIVAFVADH